MATGKLNMRGSLEILLNMDKCGVFVMENSFSMTFHMYIKVQNKG